MVLGIQGESYIPVFYDNCCDTCPGDLLGDEAFLQPVLKPNPSE
jgi:hypothetical protein